MKYSIIFLTLCLSTLDASARLQVRREGSPTMLPFTQKISDDFAKKNKRIDILISSNGSGVGIDDFCSNKHKFTSDILSSVRPMKKREIEQCFKNGVTNIIMLKTGRNGLCFLHSKEALKKKKVSKFALTTNQLFLALIKDVPTDDGKLKPNPYKKWKDINPALPDAPIKVHIPSPWQGTRGTLESDILEPNCEKIEWIKELKNSNIKRFNEICRAVRTDGLAVHIEDYELDENANVLIDNLLDMPFGEIVTIGCNLYMLHKEKPVQPLEINNVETSVENLTNGTYPLIYSMYMYFNKDRFKEVEGLEEYLKFFSLPENIGSNGLITKFGFLPNNAGENPVTEINPSNPIH